MIDAVVNLIRGMHVVCVDAAGCFLWAVVETTTTFARSE